MFDKKGQMQIAGVIIGVIVGIVVSVMVMSILWPIAQTFIRNWYNANKTDVAASFLNSFEPLLGILLVLLIIGGSGLLGYSVGKKR